MDKRKSNISIIERLSNFPLIYIFIIFSTILFIISIVLSIVDKSKPVDKINLNIKEEAKEEKSISEKEILEDEVILWVIYNSLTKLTQIAMVFYIIGFGTGGLDANYKP